MREPPLCHAVIACQIEYMIQPICSGHGDLTVANWRAVADHCRSAPLAVSPRDPAQIVTAICVVQIHIALKRNRRNGGLCSSIVRGHDCSGRPLDGVKLGQAVAVAGLVYNKSFILAFIVPGAKGAVGGNGTIHGVCSGIACDEMKFLKRDVGLRSAERSGQSPC